MNRHPIPSKSKQIFDLQLHVNSPCPPLAPCSLTACPHLQLRQEGLVLPAACAKVLPRHTHAFCTFLQARVGSFEARQEHTQPADIHTSAFNFEVVCLPPSHTNPNPTWIQGSPKTFRSARDGPRQMPPQGAQTHDLRTVSPSTRDLGFILLSWPHICLVCLDADPVFACVARRQNCLKPGVPTAGRALLGASLPIRTYCPQSCQL